MVGHLGYEADFASDAVEVIEKFVEAEEAALPFAAAILDLTILGSMGGKEAIKNPLQPHRHGSVIVQAAP